MQREVLTDSTRRRLSSRTNNASSRFANLTADDVAQQITLPYRRVLSAREINSLRRRLACCSCAGFPWCPITGNTHHTLIAYEVDTINEPALQEGIEQFFSNQGVARLFAIRQYGPSHEVDRCTENQLYDETRPSGQAAGRLDCLLVAREYDYAWRKTSG